VYTFTRQIKFCNNWSLLKKLLALTLTAMTCKKSTVSNNNSTLFWRHADTNPKLIL